MNSRRKKPPRSHPPLAASQDARPPLAASQVARPTVAALWGARPWLLGAMTALLVARPLFPSESAATHGDGLSTVMLWIALAVFWLLGAIGRPNHNSPLPSGEGQGVRAGSSFVLRFGWIDAAVVLLLVCQAAATLWAVQHGSPRPAINVFWEWIGMGLCFLLARQLIDT
ncbi:MAG: hypothetical protein K8R46_01185, partial [Pirellulales bacterium]|nr:hypothetical protein [Pirellulales bacterium]